MASKFLFAVIYDDISNKIKSGEYLPGELLPSENDICEKYKVSLITVRRALKELADQGLVSKIKGKGTLVNNNIRGSSSIGIKKNIGVLTVPFISQTESRYPEVPFNKAIYNINEWSNYIYSSIYKELYSDYNLIIGNYSKNELLNNYDNTVIKNLDRIFIVQQFDSEIINFLQSKGKLVIVYNNFDKNCMVASVNNNERQTCTEAVEYLIKIGHRRIAAINGDITFSESVERSMGYQEGLMRNSIPIDGNMIKWGNMTSESGYFLMKELLSQTILPTAVLCVNDNVAAGAILAMKEFNLKCPQDISIIGHDNNKEIYPYIEPTMSTVNPNYELIGKEIAKKLVRDVWIDNTTYIDCEFIVRDSIKVINDKDFYLNNKICVCSSID